MTDPAVEPGIPTDDGTYRYGELDRLEADLAVIEVAMEHVDAGDLDAYDRLVDTPLATGTDRRAVVG